MTEQVDQISFPQSRWEKLRQTPRPVLVLSALYLFLPVVMYFNPTGLVLWVFCGALALPHWREWQKHFRFEQIGWPARAAILLIAWAVISLTWSPVDASEKIYWIIAYVIFGSAFVFSIQSLPDDQRLSVRRMTLICVVLSSFLLFSEAMTELALSDFFAGGTAEERELRAARSVAAFVALSWPLLGVMAIGRSDLDAIPGTIAAGITLCALGVAAFQLQGFASLLALTFGGFAMLLVYWRAKLGLSIIAIFVFSYVIFAPTIHMLPIANALGNLPFSIPPEWEIQAHIWEATAERVFQNPIFGMGFDASRALGDVELIIRTERLEAISLNPQNLFLQIWLELGLVGICFISVLIGSIFIHIWFCQTKPLHAALLAAAFVSYLTEAALNFEAWETWWVITAWVVAGTTFFAPRNV